MAQNKQEFRHDSLQDLETIQDIIKSINKGLARGKLVFSDEDDEIIMEPEGLLNLKITASKDEQRSRINLRVSWVSDPESRKNKKPLKVKS
jgi:amphi-Trp domain-containing protein